jgi:hypothetical protein
MNFNVLFFFCLYRKAMALVMTSSRWLTTGAGSSSGTTHGVRLNLVNAGGPGTSWAASWIS